MKIRYIRRPSEEAGLTIYNVQTLMGLLSAILFFVGVAFGLYYAVRIITVT
jgi:hypothetical protein